MMDCYLRTFNPVGDPTYKMSIADRLIRLRSPESHSEFQFSSRYHGVSASATMSDKCRCFRIKLIDYEKHPTRWNTDVIHLSDKQEDDIFKAVIGMAGLVRMPLSVREYLQYMTPGETLYGKKALKYDLAGVSFSFILPKWRFWRPNEKWVFCSEACCSLIKVAFGDFLLYRLCDEQTPTALRLAWAEYSGRMTG